MSNLKSREVTEATVERKESMSERNQRRDVEIAKAMQDEAARHRAALGNMHRLRALRLARSRAADASTAPSVGNG
jgi:hypothetical protein